MDLQNTSYRDAHSMHPLVGALQPKNVPSLERQALSLQLLFTSRPAMRPRRVCMRRDCVLIRS